MILGFKPQFKKKILNGSKIHTIRADTHNRWKPGNIIHFATGIRTKNYKCFKKGKCKSIQAINILPDPKIIFLINNGIQTHYLSYPGMDVLAFNDGFNTLDEFWEFFNKPFFGKIIHWTDFKY